MRFHHYSIRTEEAYWQWIKRFILFHTKRNPREMGAADVSAFLSHLTAANDAARATQQQALNALVFLYAKVLWQPLGQLPEFRQSRRPPRLPEVLSRDEVRQVLAVVLVQYQLPLRLLYGTGMGKSGVNVWFISAVENLELFKISQNGNGRLCVPSVADCLEIIVLRGNVAMRFFRFRVKAHFSKVWRNIKGIIGATLRALHTYAAFNFDFLFKRGFLPVVVHVPSKGNQEFINEVFADFAFLICG
jgi:hypothetical protein